jgi:hypothetical protein
MSDDLGDSRFLDVSESAEALTGMSPEPFVFGRRLELVTDTGRLVRGYVIAAGARAAQLSPWWNDPWKDNDGAWHPAYQRVLLIVYDQVVRWAEPRGSSENGNWNPQHPDYEREMENASGGWQTWPPPTSPQPSGR